ncbi:uncharacterized protein LOC122077881 [Macadamia integrifolia]|uniref:uncharacterized protein LOC122077881 n=1 Tax=Macadamia integrifolia TaxID=60698 RepID=UPI001C4E826F|nr:uncharacterized protein LOC122077881 [Macadamia integrifolia]
MEKQPEKPREDAHHHHQQRQQPLHISQMEPVTEGAYGGGMYGTEVGQPKQPVKPPASDTQGADGPVGPNIEPKHKPPPSSGDRDIDITGQSYIQ